MQIPVKKQSWKPGNMLFPVPAALISCGGTKEWKPNLITISWTGTVCTNPPMLSISVRPERHSYDIIKQTGEFTVNLPTVKQTKATDWCGVVSGTDRRIHRQPPDREADESDRLVRRGFGARSR